MTERTWNDGEPYYCVMCGLGFAEYMACEDVVCHLETDDEAADRRKRFLSTPDVAALSQEEPGRR